MSWSQKSEQSFIAATNLLQANLFHSSVHCSYYSIVQIMYFIISEELGMTEEDINSSMVFEKSSSHKWLINKVVKLARGKQIRPRYVKRINDKIIELKDSRVSADYGENFVSQSTAGQDLENSKEIKEELSTIFGI